MPPPRVREVLSLLRDLNPEQARALLGQVVATLDAAEVIALRTYLPPQAVHSLPSCVGAATIMNEAPMPWEFVEPPASVPSIGVDTGKIIADALPPSNRRAIVTIAVVVGALILGLITSLLWLRADEPVPQDEEEVVSVVPPPPARQYAPMSAPKKVTPVKKVIKKTTARKAAPASKRERDQAAEWASPFERRH